MNNIDNLTIVLFDNAAHRTQVIALWKSIFAYDAPHNEPNLAIDKKLAHGDQLFFVATMGAEVVGTIMAGYDGHRGWIYAVAVSTTHRKQGIGSQLVKHAERALTELGCVKINLQINAENESVMAFYATLGYSVENRIDMGKKVAENIN